MDGDKIKDFLVYNFEKGIVLIVMLMSGFLVYTGLGKPIITEKHDPARLAQRATDVKRQVDDDHTDAIVNDPEKPREPNFNIAEEQDKFRKAIPADVYAINVMDPSKQSKDKQRRQDPTLPQPRGLETHGVIASLAFRSKNGLYALADLEPADELEVIEVKPKRSRSRGRDRMMEMMGGYEGEGAGMDMEMNMEMMMEEQMSMMEMGAETADGASGPVRKLANDKNLSGFTPSATKDLKTGVEQPPVPGIGLFIAGTAVIPHKEIIENYRVALSYSEGYDPMKRDLPIYIDYQVQRADVTDKSVDELTDTDWIVRDNKLLTTFNAAAYWSGFAPEIVPNDYTVPGLTMWIPPVVLDPYQDFATNPLVPLRSQRDIEAELADAEAEAAKENAGAVSIDDFEAVSGGGVSRSFGGMEEMDMEMGMEMDMEMDDGYGMGYGMGGRPGMEGKAAEENPVDYKLLRFYDFAYIKGKSRQDANRPMLNRKYVYRIRFAVNDPNFPEKPELQPKGSTLDPEAYQRYTTLSADAEQNQKRNFKRWSEWSEPSQPTSLPSFDQSAFGSVKPVKPRFIQRGQRTVRLETEAPKAEVVAESFDAALGVFVPTLIEASEGTVLSQKVESADVVDPITLEVKKTGEKTIKSSATIIDVEGGVPLELLEDDDDIIEPGLFLIMDGDGNLKVRDSVQEQRRYRIKSFAEERGL